VNLSEDRILDSKTGVVSEKACSDRCSHRSDCVGYKFHGELDNRQCLLLSFRYDPNTFDELCQHVSISAWYGKKWNSGFRSGVCPSSESTSPKHLREEAIGSVCSGDTEILCNHIWTGGSCRWDCAVLETDQDLKNLNRNVEKSHPEKFWTIKSHDPFSDHWRGCHYKCYSSCQFCKEIANLLVCGGPFNGKCPLGYSCVTRVYASELFGICVAKPSNNPMTLDSVSENVEHSATLPLIVIALAGLLIAWICRRHKPFRKSKDSADYILMLDE